MVLIVLSGSDYGATGGYGDPVSYVFISAASLRLESGIYTSTAAAPLAIS